MSQLSKCMVALSPEVDGQKALDSALHWLGDREGEIDLVCVDHSPPITPGYYFHDYYRLAPMKRARIARYTKWIEAIADSVQTDQRKVTAKVLEGFTEYETLAEYVVNTQPEIVFYGVGYHTHLERAFMSHPDWQMLKACPVPLMLVKHRQWAENPKIVAAIDPLHTNDEESLLDRAILSIALEIEALKSGDLSVFHSTHQSLLSGNEEVKTQMGEFQRERCEELLDSMSISTDKLQFSEQSVVTALSEYCNDQRVDLLIMGAVSRSRLAEVFVGRVAERLIDTINCDVLIIKPPGLVRSLISQASEGSK